MKGTGARVAVLFLVGLIVLVIRGVGGLRPGDGSSDAGVGASSDTADPPGD